MNKLILYLLLLLPLCSSGQEHLLRNEYQYRLSNGSSLLLVEDRKATETTMYLTARLGPYLEDTTTNGAFIVCFELLKAGLIERLGDHTSVSGHMQTEYFIFELSKLSNKNIYLAVEEIQNVFTHAWWDSTDLEKAKYTALQQATTDPLGLMSEKLSDQLWGNDAAKLSDLAHTEHLLALDSSLISDLFNSLFCPSLMQLAIHTPVEHRQLRTQMMLHWNDWAPCRVPHSVVNFVPSFKPMEFSLQNLEVSSINSPLFMQLVQGPSVFNGQKDLLFGLLIEELLSNSDTVNMLLDSLQLHNLTLKVRGGNYASEIWLYAQHNSDSSAISGLHAYSAILDSLTDTTRTIFTHKEMAKAKAIIVDQLQDIVVSIHRTMLLSKNWGANQVELTTELSNAFNELTATDMILSLRKYFVGPNVASAVLLSDSSQLNSELTNSYVTTTDTILEHVFHFKKNTGRFANDDYETKLNQLFQFMNSNTFNLQVVGYSSKAELGQVSDNEMTRFFKSEDMPYIVTSGRKAKLGSFPLELYRVIVVMRYLVERGIDPLRLTGTGMRLSKNDKFKERSETVHFKMHY